MKNDTNITEPTHSCEIPKATSCAVPAPKTKNADIVKPIADSAGKLNEKKEKCTCGGNCSQKKPG